MGSRKNYVILRRLTKKGFHVEMSGHIKLTFRYNGRDTAIRTWVSRRRRLAIGCSPSWPSSSIFPDSSSTIWWTVGLTGRGSPHSTKSQVSSDRRKSYAGKSGVVSDTHHVIVHTLIPSASASRMNGFLLRTSSANSSSV